MGPPPSASPEPHSAERGPGHFPRQVSIHATSPGDVSDAADPLLQLEHLVE